MSKEIYSFTLEQLAIILRGTIGIANEFYATGKYSNEEVFKMAVASEIEGLMTEQILVDRGVIPQAEFQICKPEAKE